MTNIEHEPGERSVVDEMRGTGGRHLAGLTAYVTGAGSGIGRASARLFARHGARVAVVDVNENTGRQTAEDIREDDGEGFFVQADVSVPEDVERSVAIAVTGMGTIDVLFCAAGVSGRKWGDGPADECTVEAWDRVMAANLKSVFLCCKYVLPAMLRGSRGSIITLSSVLGLVGGDEDFATHAYAASKGGIISFTKGVASFYAPHGIRANVICPGLIETAMSRRAQGDRRIVKRLAELQPLGGTFGQAEDVAEAALYFASDRSRFVTGTVLTVDGGWTVR